MSLIDSHLENEDSFIPDYRDTILYNGIIEYQSTGKFVGDLIEFCEISNPTNKILVNCNLQKTQYIKNHANYDLVRNKDGSSFATFEITMAQGTFLPTGRTFKNEAGLDLLWEFMQKNNPERVIYFQFPMNENFITGRQCLEM